MSDTIDRLAAKLDEEIQYTMSQIEGQNEYAWLHGKLLLISGQLAMHHWKYSQAVTNSQETEAAKHSHAIVACERAYHKALRPGALDIDVSVGF